MTDRPQFLLNAIFRGPISAANSPGQDEVDRAFQQGIPKPTDEALSAQNRTGGNQELRCRHAMADFGAFRSFFRAIAKQSLRANRRTGMLMVPMREIIQWPSSSPPRS